MAKTYSYEEPTEYKVGVPEQRPLAPSNSGEFVFVGGVPFAEHQKRQAMPTRSLRQEDVPNEIWNAGYDQYSLRDDGAIISNNGNELGWVDTDKGLILWCKAGF